MNDEAGAVVPGYHLVWYNSLSSLNFPLCAVVPGYHLVWYNPYFPNPPIS